MELDPDLKLAIAVTCAWRIWARLLGSVGSVGFVGFVAVTACGPGSADETATESGSTSGPTSGSTGAPTTGEEPPPALDCEVVPTVLDAPQSVSEPAEFSSDVVAGLDGDAVLLTYDALIKYSAGAPVWSHAYEAGERAQALASLPDGRVVAGGYATGDETAVLLMLVGADGQRLATRTHDLAPGLVEQALAIAVTPGGDVFAAVLASTPDEPKTPSVLRLDRYDAELGHVWSVGVDGVGFQPGLAVDGDGNTYLGTISIASTEEFEYTWSLGVMAFDPAGEPRWTADALEFRTWKELAAVDISVGDQVYVLANNASGFALRALSTAGAPAWEIVRGVADGGEHVLRAAAASPCGGVFVGGRSDVEIDLISERASLFHIAADGTLGAITTVLDTPHEGEYEYDVTTTLAVSPLGRVIAAGRLRPAAGGDGDDLPWLHAY